jgi:hypothetical protein
MRKFLILFLVVFSGTVKAQDYFPMSIGKYWVYDLYDASGNSLGEDSVIIKYSDVLDGNTRFLYVGFSSQGIDTVVYYNDKDNTNNVRGIKIVLSIPFNLKLAQHQYANGDSWNEGLVPFKVSFIDTTNVPADNYLNCFMVSADTNIYGEIINQKFIYAPDVGLVRQYEKGILTRQLKRFGVENLTSFSVNLSDSDFKIYPNPTTQMIFFNDCYDLVDLYDLSGNNVWKEKNVCHSLNLSNLKQGVYVLKIVKNDNTQFVSVIKK